MGQHDRVASYGKQTENSEQRECIDTKCKLDDSDSELGQGLEKNKQTDRRKEASKRSLHGKTRRGGR